MIRKLLIGVWTAVGTCAGAFAGEAFLDFADPNLRMSWWSPAKKDNTCGLAFVTNALTGRSTLRMSWDGKGTWMHAYAEPLPKPWPADGRLGVRVTVTVTDPVPVKEFNLRFQDAERETFYFPRKVKWSKPGQYRLSYVVDTNDLSAARIVKHGPTANGRIDLPLKSFGFNANFAYDGEPGSVLVDSVEVRPLPHKDVTTYPERGLARPFCDLAELPMLVGRGGSAEKATSLATGKAAVRCVAPKPTPVLGVDFCRFGSPNGALAPKFPRDAATALFVDVTTEMSVDLIRLKVIDTHSGISTFDFRLPELATPGRHVVRLDVPAAFVSNDRRNKDKSVGPFALAGIDFRAKAKFTGAAWVNGIGARVKASPARLLALDLDTGTVPRVVPPGTKTVKAFLENVADSPLALDVRFRLEDFRDDVVGMERCGRMSFAAGERKAFDIPVPVRQGVYYAVVDVRADGEDEEQSVELKRSFGVLKLTGATLGVAAWPGFCFGSVCHLNPYFGNAAEIEKMADAMAQVGLKVLRTDFRANSDWDYEWYDKVVDIFSKRGLAFDMILGYAAKPDGSADYEKSLAGYRKAFARYKGRVLFWEMLNEPDIDWGRQHPLQPDSYAELARRTRAALKEIDPSAVFMSAGFCCFDHKIMGKFQREAMGLCWREFDLHCFHGHGPYWHYVGTIDDRLLAMRKELGIDIPWYSNETALSMSAGTGEKLQAEAQFKKTLFAWSRGARGLTWYNMRGKGENDDDGEHGYGMLTMRLDPRAVYGAWNAFTALYRGKRFREELSAGEGNRCFVLESDKHVVAGFWREKPKDAAVVLKTDAERAYLADIFGNRQSLEVRDGKIALRFTEEPQSLILPPGSSLRHENGEE